MTADSAHRRVIWRSRWAAIGAAIAVSFGAAGLYSVHADSPSSSFVAIAPTRVLDTRINAGLTGAFTSGAARTLDVTGAIQVVLPGDVVSTGSPVPDGATGIVANVTAVGPTNPGFVSVRPGNASGAPTTSNLNVSPGQVVPNSVTVEIPTAGAGAGSINIVYQGNDPAASTHLLVDIVGYYAAAVDDSLQTVVFGVTDVVWDTTANLTTTPVNGCVTNTSAFGRYVYMPLRVPVGARLISIDASVLDTGGPTSYTVELYRRITQSVGITPTQLATSPTLGSQTVLVHTVLSPSTTEIATANADYYVRVGSFQNTANAFCQLSVTYDTRP